MAYLAERYSEDRKNGVSAFCALTGILHKVKECTDCRPISCCGRNPENSFDLCGQFRIAEAFWCVQIENAPLDLPTLALAAHSRQSILIEVACCLYKKERMKR